MFVEVVFSLDLQCVGRESKTKLMKTYAYVPSHEEKKKVAIFCILNHLCILNYSTISDLKMMFIYIEITIYVNQGRMGPPLATANIKKDDHLQQFYLIIG